MSFSKYLTSATPVSRNILLFKIFSFLWNFRFFTPFAILYFTQITGSYARGMSIFSFIFLSKGLAELPTGIWSDRRIGRKNSILIGSVLLLVSTVCFAVAQEYWMLVLGGVLQGVATGFVFGKDISLLYETMSESGETRRFPVEKGKIDSFFAFGSLMSALLGAVIVLYSYRMTFLLSVLPMLLLVLTTLFLHENYVAPKHAGSFFRHIRESMILIFKNKSLRRIIIPTEIDKGIINAVDNFQSAFIKTLIPDWMVGLFNALLNLVKGFSSYVSGATIERFGFKNVFILGTLIHIVCYAAIFIANHIMILLFILVPKAPQATTTTAGNTVSHNEYPNALRSTLSGLMTILKGLVTTILAPIIGWMADIYGPMIALVVSCVLAKTIILILYLIGFWKQRKT